MPRQRTQNPWNDRAILVALRGPLWYSAPELLPTSDIVSRMGGVALETWCG
jgi:hypothetical protein